jgi:hypothetical protein
LGGALLSVGVLGVGFFGGLLVADESADVVEGGGVGDSGEDDFGAVVVDDGSGEGAVPGLDLGTASSFPSLPRLGSALTRGERIDKISGVPANAGRLMLEREREIRNDHLEADPAETGLSSVARIVCGRVFERSRTEFGCGHHCCSCCDDCCSGGSGYDCCSCCDDCCSGGSGYDCCSGSGYDGCSGCGL